MQTIKAYPPCDVCDEPYCGVYREEYDAFMCDGCADNNDDATRASCAWEDENGCDYED